MKRIALLVVLILVDCRLLVAQPTLLKFAHLDINDGLTHNHVSCFLKDHKGFLWIGTESGLNRFDGYQIKKYLNDPQDTLSLKGNNVTEIFQLPGAHLGILTTDGMSIYDAVKDAFINGSTDYLHEMKLHPDSISTIIRDKTGRYWFARKSGGVIVFDDARKHLIEASHQTADSTSIDTGAITAIAEDQNGFYWLAHNDGILEQASLADGHLKIAFRCRVMSVAKYDHNIKLKVDNDGDVWIYSLNDNLGVLLLDVRHHYLQGFNKSTKPVVLSTNIVSSVVPGDDHSVWVGTDHGGVNLIDKKRGTVVSVMHHDEDPESLSQNSVTTIYRDDEGIVWLGTYKHGVDYYHRNIIRFPLYKHFLIDKSGLPFNDVNRFVEDAKGNLWIGTNGGGLIYLDRANNTYRQYRNNPKDPNSLSSDVVVSLMIDRKNVLWIGTFYGGMNSFDGKRFTRYLPVSNDPFSLSSLSVWEIFQDSHGRIWVGTLDAGLELFDPSTGRFTHYRKGDVNSVRSTYISAITEDRDGDIWFGTSQGVDVLVRETGRFIHYENEKKNPLSISSNVIFDIHQTKNGKIWIGTPNGLNYFDKLAKAFKVYKEGDGLPSNSVLTVLEDQQGNLWLGTANGLSRVVQTEKHGVESVAFQNFDESDGLQGKQFNENAALQTRRGELIFGGGNGFNLFDPARLGTNTRPPQVVLTDFELFAKSVHPGERVDGHLIMSSAISETQSITLPAAENVFSIEFAALSYFHPEKNKYLYNLEGFTTEWLAADVTSRKITFTNLNPGDYTFRVKAANNDGVWSKKGAELKITVLPPFWKTKAAFVAYVLFIIGALLLTRKLIQQREHMKFVIRQERQEALRLHELDMMKIKFFTNISHEFRTPLSLIIAPVEKLLKQTNEGDQRNQFIIIQRNAKRLLNLVSQLLDFRKIEVQGLKYSPSEGDIIAFVRDTVMSFADLSEKRSIRLSFDSSVASILALFDQDKLEKILFNLLSNAFKFTPENGSVQVKVQLKEQDDNTLVIKVMDNGIGIPLDKQDRIFERFFQNDLPKSMVNQGSGIGLSISKEFVRVMNGNITLESAEGKGTTFIVEIPLTGVVEKAALTGSNRNLDSKNVDELEQLLLPSVGESSDVTKPVLLLIEDNEDFRFYLKDNLRDAYHVLEAQNGQEGFSKILEYLPDLIVSDIMMPIMNGIELTRRVRADVRISHIPIILLTARTSEEHKLEGFEAGTNDYLTKPFSFEILLSRIKNLIQQREKYQQNYNRVDVKASELNITSLDEKFVQDAIRCVEKNIESTEFSVEDLSRELAISRAHLYKKIQALTGKSPLEFMRTIRLQQAAQLLEKSQLTVAEIAYRVGFNNPKYFARYFKDEFGMLPSVYASSKRQYKGR